MPRDDLLARFESGVGPDSAIERLDNASRPRSMSRSTKPSYRNETMLVSNREADSRFETDQGGFVSGRDATVRKGPRISWGSRRDAVGESRSARHLRTIPFDAELLQAIVVRSDRLGSRPAANALRRPIRIATPRTVRADVDSPSGSVTSESLRECGSG
ncbi:MAG TPA: hypothetical protein DCQ98_11455 [Planctomycetaceae bacterium]|nr:hypothetical protein [Planctomycetaceae bacterium]